MTVCSDNAAREPRPLLSAKQTAKQLGISTRFLYTLTQRQEISCVRVGRRNLYAPEAIQQFIVDHSQATTVLVP